MRFGDDDDDEDDEDADDDEADEEGAGVRDTMACSTTISSSTEDCTNAIACVSIV